MGLSKTVSLLLTDRRKKVYNLVLTAFMQVYVYHGNHHSMRNGKRVFVYTYFGFQTS